MTKIQKQQWTVPTNLLARGNYRGRFLHKCVCRWNKSTVWCHGESGLERGHPGLQTTKSHHLSKSYLTHLSVTASPTVLMCHHVASHFPIWEFIHVHLRVRWSRQSSSWGPLWSWLHSVLWATTEQQKLFLQSKNIYLTTRKVAWNIISVDCICLNVHRVSGKKNIHSYYWL